MPGSTWQKHLQALWPRQAGTALALRPPFTHPRTLPTHPTTPHQLSWLYAPSFWPSGFGGLLWYWLRELSLGLVPWTTLLAVSIPLPLKHGV